MVGRVLESRKHCVLSLRERERKKDEIKDIHFSLTERMQTMIGIVTLISCPPHDHFSMLAPLIVAPFCEAGEAGAMHLHMAGHVTPPSVGMIAHDYVPLAHEFGSSWKNKKCCP